MTPGDLLAFFGTFALLMNPLRNLNEVNIKLNQAAACDRIFQILDWKSNLHESRHASTDQKIRARPSTRERLVRLSGRPLTAHLEGRELRNSLRQGHRAGGR